MTRLRHRLGVRPPRRRAADGPQARDGAVHAAGRQARGRRDAGRVRGARGRGGDRPRPRGRRADRAGRLDLPAANEPGALVRSTVFLAPLGQPDPRPLGEIEELRWQPLGRRSPDLAPLLVEHVLPELEVRGALRTVNGHAAITLVQSRRHRRDARPLLGRLQRRGFGARGRWRGVLDHVLRAAVRRRSGEHGRPHHPVPAQRHSANPRRLGRSRRLRRHGDPAGARRRADRRTRTGVRTARRSSSRWSTARRRTCSSPAPAPGMRRHAGSSTASRRASTWTTPPGHRTVDASSTAARSTATAPPSARSRPSRCATGRVQVLLGPWTRQFTRRGPVVPRRARDRLRDGHKTGPELEADLSGVTFPSCAWTRRTTVRSVTDPALLASTGLTDPSLFAGTADWSPDGRWIVYSALAAPDDEARTCS